MSTLRPGEPDARNGRFLNDVLDGLRLPRKQLSPKYFYDEIGSRLFERICDLPEYYITRIERAIMRRHAGEMGEALGPDTLLIEPGSGNSDKVRLLIDALPRPAGYIPVEISGEHMLENVEALQADYPGLDIHPVCADFTANFALPHASTIPRRRAVYFPGSTIGNFPPAEATALLGRIHRLVGPGGALLLGADLQKDPAVLIPAYDDAAGVTAAFNRNLLVRINRELGGDFDPDAFDHRAVWNAAESRIEMHLVSRRNQQARVAGETFAFAAGEPLVTEYSYKHTADSLGRLVEGVGFRLARRWTDDQDWFGVFLLEWE